MVKTKIDDFTDLVISRERFFAFFIWNNSQKYGVKLDRHEIEDVLSDSYLKAVTKLRDHNLKLEYPLAWFSRIIYLTLMNYIRKRIKENKNIDIAEIEGLEDMNFVYETIDQNQTDEHLKAIIKNKLSKEDAKILHMSLEGYSSKEISDMVGKTDDAVRKIKSRLIKKLKPLLK